MKNCKNKVIVFICFSIAMLISGTKVCMAEELTNYKIDVILDVDSKSIVCNQKVEYINNIMDDLDEVYLRIYPNAYMDKETTPAQFGFNETYPNGFSAGSIEIANVTSSDKKLEYTIEGEDSTVLVVSLEETINKGDKIDLELTYKVNLPNAKDRLGWHEREFNLGNWYPIVAMHDESGWRVDPYYGIGDPFYSDVANYNVSIEVPKGYTVASTGNQLDKIEESNYDKFVFEENNVRDFAWVASDRFEVQEGEVDGIALRCYSISDEASLNSQYVYSEQSLLLFNEVYGMYPYETYSVVETNFTTGMEYPGIVFISDDEHYKEIGFFEMIICHETAHQWWYGVVGCDQINEAWLDESLATYSEYIYREKFYDGAEQNEMRASLSEKRVNQMRGDETDMVSPVYEFEMEEYGLIVYEKGAAMHHNIRKEVGDEVFEEIIKTYYEENKFENVSTEDYITVVETVTGEDWQEFFNEWLYAG